MLTALYNTLIVADGNITGDKAVIIEDNQIRAVTPVLEIPAQAERIDLKGAYLAPGLIDLQIYGAGGALFGGNPSVEALQRMEADLLPKGTTGFFATVATNSDEVVLDAIEAAKAYRPKAVGSFLGLHLEGPYINPARKGAHPEKYIKKATLSEIKQWIEMAAGEIKMITLAPELQDQEVLDYLQQQNIILSSGHSDATYQQIKSFIGNPIQAITHLYNAMPPIHHRAPGIIPAVFEAKPYTSIVADGVHVDYAMIALAKRELGDKLFLITDAVTETDQGTYQHRLAGNRYVMPDGTLSGSALTLLKAVQNCVQHVGVTLPEAVNMASLYPAQLAMLITKGKVEAGYDADLIIFDAEFNIQFTLYKGKVYRKSN
ncbi:N-acetylglucosamine-6-phosphate deacetylase [Mucilaginibacter sp. Bleaf8]|uniref:N-acetylglucosamine-6-phosphate deacetylase n=1 Tax=Mucilaginibacter sp. Bleaf8 TaxID=2834430 RepID=UPI001BCD9F3A|nr:N-acetylglucosamine-6-phosphate deacetylase [Mucilaginibacter sp. Bleaf8]MBS7564336.1 N-acetylglucosamine-6-phosphate deacetylase [Mucilaginibacter sp. Bleaf8]